MITQLPEQCWVVEANHDDIDATHHDTRQQAITAAVDANADATIAHSGVRCTVRQEAEPCFAVVCDRCGEHLVNGDTEDMAHLPDRDAARTEALAYEWAVEWGGNRAWCHTCRHAPVPPR